MFDHYDLKVYYRLLRECRLIQWSLDKFKFQKLIPKYYIIGEVMFFNKDVPFIKLVGFRRFFPL